MKLSRFQDFKSKMIKENIETETEVNTPEVEEQEGPEFTKLVGKKSDTVVLNGIKFKRDNNVKFIFDSGYIIFNINDITNEQTELSVLDSTIKNISPDKDYMIFNSDVFKSDMFKLYYNFASENNKWLKNITLKGLQEIDFV